MRVLILLHKKDVRAEETNYFVWAFRDLWRARGIEVVVARGTRRLPGADLLLPHIDLSVVPDEYLRLYDRYPVVVNRAVRDIRKAVISANLVRPGDGWEGPVIVKTDWNCGGAPERRLLRSARRGGSDLATARTLDPGSYPVFASPREVPEGVWSNSALVVERFLPERDGESFVLRNYSFFGGRHTNVRRLSTLPVVKAGTTLRQEEVPRPDEIVALRRRLGFDFGKFDYVLREGRAILLDANKTPTYAGRGLTEVQRSRAETLAEGITLFSEGQVE